jgi:hypothetical protein
MNFFCLVLIQICTSKQLKVRGGRLQENMDYQVRPVLAVVMALSKTPHLLHYEVMDTVPLSSVQLLHDGAR